MRVSCFAGPVRALSMIVRQHKTTGTSATCHADGHARSCTAGVPSAACGTNLMRSTPGAMRALWVVLRVPRAV